MLRPIKSGTAAILDSFGAYLDALETVRAMPLAAVVAELGGFKSDVESTAMRHLAEQLGIEPLIVRMTAARILSAHGRLAVVRAFGREARHHVPGMTAEQLDQSGAIRSLLDRGYTLDETGAAAAALESIGAPVTVALIESTVRKMREAR